MWKAKKKCIVKKGFSTKKISWIQECLICLLEILKNQLLKILTNVTLVVMNKLYSTGVRMTITNMQWLQNLLLDSQMLLYLFWICNTHSIIIY